MVGSNLALAYISAIHVLLFSVMSVLLSFLPSALVFCFSVTFFPSKPVKFTPLRFTEMCCDSSYRHMKKVRKGTGYKWIHNIAMLAWKAWQKTASDSLKSWQRFWESLTLYSFCIGWHSAKGSVIGYSHISSYSSGFTDQCFVWSCL